MSGRADEIALRIDRDRRGHAEAAERARPTAPPIPTRTRIGRFLGLYQMLRLRRHRRVEYRDGKLILKVPPAHRRSRAPRRSWSRPTTRCVFMVRGGRYSGEPLTFSIADDTSVTGSRHRLPVYPGYRSLCPGTARRRGCSSHEHWTRRA